MRLINRDMELQELNRLLKAASSQAQILMMYGRGVLAKLL
jgi:hypothetical protein